MMVGGRVGGRRVLLALLPMVLAGADAPSASASVSITPLASNATLGRPIALTVGGRVVADAASAGYRRQWPGTYFEGRFRGAAVDLTVGPGDVALRIGVDGAAPVSLVHPAAGSYRIAAPGVAPHRIRIDVISESQAGPTTIVGLSAPAGTTPLAPPPPRQRQIEFIGDSHTVGYGNASRTAECTESEVWTTTDTPRGPAGVTAARFDADYRVNAISGRGVVRNYGGFSAPTLPQAYPFALLDGVTPDRTTGWHPQVVVIGLGTNDFSTPLKSRERWPTREALRADYERTYAAFVRELRRRNPKALILLWATDLAGGEIAREASAVVATLTLEGDRHVAFVPVSGLRFAGCHGHPGLADDRRIAATLSRAIDGHGDVWRRMKD